MLFDKPSNLLDTKAEHVYRCIVVDPPWNQGKTGRRTARPNQGLDLNYSTMSKADLENMPIATWAADNCFLWLWTTNSKDRKTGEPFIKMSFDLLTAWGFTFYTMITWDKKTGPCPFGPYQVTTEYVLFAYKGTAKFRKSCLGKLKTSFTEVPTAHSVKPASFYAEICKHFDGPRLDVFARQVRSGFDGWGNEYGKYEENVKRPASLAPPGELDLFRDA